MLQRFIFAILVFGFSPLYSQFQGVDTYRDLSVYVDTMEVSFPKIAGVTSTVLTLDQNHLDSLESYVFPVMEAKEMDTLFRLFTYQQMAVMSYQLMGEVERALDYQEKEIELIKVASDSSYLMMAYTRKMFMQNDLGRDDQAYATSLKVVKLLETEEDGVNKVYALRQLCVFYRTVSDLDRAIEYCEKGIELNESLGESYYMGDLYTSLVGVMNERSLTSSQTIPLRKKALVYAKMNKDTLGIHAIYSHLAQSLAQDGQIDSASKYFELSLQSYSKHPYLFGWVQELSSYGQFLIEVGQDARAAEILDTLVKVVDQNSISPDALQPFYLFRSGFAAKKGDFQDYSFWIAKRDSLLIAVFDEKKAQAQEEMVAKYETEKKEAQNQLLLAENRARLIGLIALSGLVILLVAIIVLVIQRRHRDRQIHDQKQLLLAFELEKAKQEKDLADERSRMLKHDLDQRIKQVMEQQVINGELMDLIEELRSTAESSFVKKKTSQMKTKLNENMILQVFDEILGKMKELHPELLMYLEDAIGADKENEIVSTAMYFLGYQTKDIAKILQRTEKAVRSMRYRVRKKIGLADGDDLIIHLSNIKASLA